MTVDMPHRLLFVCTGNICRSPMAEGLARRYAEQRSHHVEVQSASLMGLDGRPAEPHAVKVMGKINIDISGHRAQPLDMELIDWADYVLVMELRQAAKIRAMAPAAENKILLLGNFGRTMEIADPLGGWQRDFRKTRDEIKLAVENFMDLLPPKVQH